MKIASYNVQCFSYNKEKEEIFQVLRTVNPDVVGIQEVDWDSARCGPGNQVQIAAEALGYPYWYFAKAIDYKGGAYGHGVLSRYPILEAETVPYETVGENDHDGGRCFARLLLEVEGVPVAFYNTHLTLDREGRSKELQQLFARMKQDPCVVLTGDMNAESEEMAAAVDTAQFTMLNPGLPTWPQGESSVKSIDHIVVSNTLKHSPQITVYPAECSDHNLIYTEVEVKK